MPSNKFPLKRKLSRHIFAGYFKMARFVVAMSNMFPLLLFQPCLHTYLTWTGQRTRHILMSLSPRALIQSVTWRSTARRTRGRDSLARTCHLWGSLSLEISPSIFLSHLESKWLMIKHLNKFKTRERKKILSLLCIQNGPNAFFALSPRESPSTD